MFFRQLVGRCQFANTNCRIGQRFGDCRRRNPKFADRFHAFAVRHFAEWGGWAGAAVIDVAVSERQNFGHVREVSGNDVRGECFDCATHVAGGFHQFVHRVEAHVDVVEHFSVHGFPFNILRLNHVVCRIGRFHIFRQDAICS